MTPVALARPQLQEIRSSVEKLVHFNGVAPEKALPAATYTLCLVPATVRISIDFSQLAVAVTSSFGRKTSVIVCLPIGSFAQNRNWLIGNS
jgi:hypothetical protein